tara:strand:- start:3036 stop:4196 length:1161 start_codon:yes stop_codon:yes gene_type:complete
MQKANSKSQIICKNCVMDISDTEIIFDSNGYCDHCNLFFKRDQKNWTQSITGQKEIELENEVRLIKDDRSNQDYDCLIGISGGCDSSYLLYYLVKECGLKPLCLHVDGGWNTKGAVSNIKNLTTKLKVDLIVKVVDWEEMKSLQLAFLKSGVSHLDTPQDHAFFAYLHQYAKKFNLTRIISGGNLSTEAVQVPLKWIYYTSDTAQLNDIEKKFCEKPLIQFPKSSVFHRKLYLPYIRGIKVSYPLNQIRYIKSEAELFLEDNYEFETFPEKHYESNFTKFYEAVILPQRFGFDTRKITYSSKILTGQMKRSEALERLDQAGISADEEYKLQDFVADKLGVSYMCMENFKSQEIKNYKDYKNNSNIYNLGAFFSKLIPGVDSSGAKR